MFVIICFKRQNLKEFVSKELYLKAPLFAIISHVYRKVKRSTIQIYDGICLKMPCTRFFAPCFQLVQQSYTKSALLVIMRLLESSIA